MMRVRFGSYEIDPSLAVLVGAEGLDAGTVEVQSEGYALTDGAHVSGARMGARTVRLRYRVVGDPEEARAALYEAFEPKRTRTLEVATGSLDVICSCTVGAVEADPWSRAQEVEATLVAGDPWLYSKEAREFEPDSMSQWTVSNAGATVGFVAQVATAGYVRIAGKSARIAWDATEAAGSGALLTLDTRERHRDLYSETDGVRTSYLDCITEWHWPQVPHLPNGVGYVRSNGAAIGALTIRERWAGI